MSTPPHNEQTLAWIALGMIPRVGGKLLTALLATFGDPTTVLQADYKALRTVPGVGHKTAESILAVDVAYVSKQLEQWQKQGIQTVTWDDQQYPSQLTDVDDRPPVLFALGTPGPEATRQLALVGTRQPSPEARLLTAQLGYKLADAGWGVVSGLALGIDTAAHQSALATRQSVAMTQAVVGCGVDVVYPTENRALRSRILERGGAILSEVAPGVAPAPSLLVARNRIITGLAQVVVVIESQVEGGAMHAARFAYAQGREVWTVDDAQATGNQKLIAEGAKVIPLHAGGLDQFIAVIERDAAP
jgi:DNA processing protein